MRRPEHLPVARHAVVLVTIERLAIGCHCVICIPRSDQAPYRLVQAWAWAWAWACLLVRKAAMRSLVIERLRVCASEISSLEHRRFSTCENCHHIVCVLWFDFTSILRFTWLKLPYGARNHKPKKGVARPPLRTPKTGSPTKISQTPKPQIRPRKHRNRLGPSVFAPLPASLYPDARTRQPFEPLARRSA